MKIFKYFTWSEIKEICIRLDKEHCYFRNPKKNFVKILGEDTTNRLVKMGWLKDSPYIPNCHDYTEPCYEYGIFFRKLYNYHVNKFGIWLKCYVFQIWRLKYIKDNIIYKLTGKRPVYYEYN